MDQPNPNNHSYPNSYEGSPPRRQPHDGDNGARSEYYHNPAQHSQTQGYQGNTNFYPPPPPPPPYPPTQSKPIIADAVNHAFDNSAAANQVPADVIAQITEQVRSQVIDTLRKELSSTASPSSQSQPQTQQPYSADANYSHDAAQQARPTSSAANQHQAPHREINTNIPHPLRTNLSTSLPQATSFMHNLSPSTSTHEQAYHQDDNRAHETHAGHDAQRQFNAPAPVASVHSDTVNPVEHARMKEDLSQRHGERNREDPSVVSFERPLPTRVRTNDEETVIEKMWQPLFEGSGLLTPTLRLSQFLRGIALHLIEEYEPKNSLVVGPFKMKRFFKEMKISDDIVPWEDVFMLRSVHLSAFFTELKCQHHLIPRSSTPHEPPHLAALTPDGFASFLILLIQADPELEFQRLAQTLREWPVSNADERKERWPKELSRRLLPKTGSDHYRRQLLDALHRAGIPVPGSHSTHPVPGSNHRSDVASDDHTASATGPFKPPPPPASAPPHHQRSNSFKKPRRHDESGGHKGTHHEYATGHSSDESSSPSVVIERERKPYIAKEGSGRIYEEAADLSKSSSATSATHHISQQSTRDKYSSVPDAGPPSHHKTSGTSNTARSRERGSSVTQDSYPAYKRASRTRSPAHSQGYGHSSADRVDSASTSYAPRYDDERYYADDRDRDRHYDDERDRQRRYAKYDEEYRKGNGVFNTYAGNPPLGTGERRY